MIELTDLPDNWSLVELGDIFSWASGKGLTQKQMSDDGEYAVYGGNGVAGFHSDWLCETESLVIGRVGAQCGNVHIAPIKSWITDNAIYASSINIPINLKYFHNLLKYRKLNELAGGSGQPYVSQSLLNPVKVPLPPLNEQRRIVSTIEQLTDRSHKARVALADVPKLIAQFRQSVLAAAFRGDLTADWRKKNPDVEPASELLERIKIDRRKRWEESSKLQYKPPQNIEIDRLPKLPESWSWGSLDQLLYSLRNGLSRKPADEMPGIPILRISALRSMNLDINDIRFYRPEDNENVESYFLDEGDLLFTRYNGNREFVGVCGRVNQISGKLLHPDKLIRGRVISSELFDSRFLEIVCNSGISKKHIESYVKTSAGQHGISGSDLKTTPIPIPPICEQRKIVEIVTMQLITIKSIEDITASYFIDSQQLDRSILAKAFRGELVPQDPNDEPAAALLERIRAERDRTSTTKQRGKTTRKNSSKQLSIDLE